MPTWGDIVHQQIVVNVKPATSAPATPAGQSAPPPAAAVALPPVRRRLKQAAILPSAVVPSAATAASSGDHGAASSGSSDPSYAGALQMVLVDSAGLSSANTLNGQRSIVPQRAALSSAMAALGFTQVRSLDLWVFKKTACSLPSGSNPPSGGCPLNRSTADVLAACSSLSRLFHE